MATLEPEKSNYLSLGSWNPAIIQPEWLRNEFPEVVPETIGVEIMGPSLGVRFNLDDFSLQPSNDKLIFFPKKIDEETLNRISELSNGIIDRLQYTPITAAGCNFFFSLDSNERFYNDELGNENGIKDFSDVLGISTIVSRSVQHTYSLENHNVNISYDYKGNDRFLRINFDYQIPNVAMIEASNKLVENFNLALKLSEQLIIKT